MIVAAVFVSILLIAGPEPTIASTLPQEDVVLETGTGTHIIRAEIADTDIAKATGLMFRQQLADDAGMLFIYERPQNFSMWMKNTYIPLDMIFIGPDLRISRIERDTEPFSTRVIEAGPPAIAVLEVNAGTANRLGLRRGDRVEAPSLQATN
jgi:uncharacterized membrane protein (UPF0127 family)